MRTLLFVLVLSSLAVAQTVSYAGEPCVRGSATTAVRLSHTGTSTIGTMLTFHAAPTLVGDWAYWIGTSDRSCSGVPLPWSGLITLGCPVYVCPIAVLTTDNRGTLPLSIPADRSLLGLILHLQASKVQSIPPFVRDYFTTNYATIVVG